jgi:hypothetical protein
MPVSGGNDSESSRFSGIINYKFEKKEMRDLLDKLKNPCKIGEVPKDFMRDLFNPDLVDLVALIDIESEHNIALVKNCARKKELWGARNIYAMIFAIVKGNRSSLLSTKYDTSKMEIEVNLKKMSDDTTTEATISNSLSIEATLDSTKVPGNDAFVEVARDSSWAININKNYMQIPLRHSQLDYRRGIGERSVRGIIGSISSFFGLSSDVKEQAISARDTTYVIKRWRVLYEGPLYDEDTVTVVYGYKKFPVLENTINGVTIIVQSRDVDLYNRFGNYSSSYIGTSIGLMGSASEKELAYDSTTFFINHVGFQPFFSRMEVEPFFFLHFYILAPKLPPLERYRASLSAVVGSKIDFPNFPSDLFIGAGLGHIRGGSLHILAGWNISRFESQSGEFYKGEPMFGLSYGL